MKRIFACTVYFLIDCSPPADMKEKLCGEQLSPPDLLEPIRQVSLFSRWNI